MNLHGILTRTEVLSETSWRENAERVQGIHDKTWQPAKAKHENYKRDGSCYMNVFPARLSRLQLMCTFFCVLRRGRILA